MEKLEPAHTLIKLLNRKQNTKIKVFLVYTILWIFSFTFVLVSNFILYGLRQYFVWYLSFNICWDLICGLT